VKSKRVSLMRPVGRRPRKRRGTSQLSLAVRATVRHGKVDELRRLLDRMAQGESGAPALELEALNGVHFARLFLIEDSVDLDGKLIPATLMWMSEIDAPLARHVRELAEVSGQGLDAAFGLCEGYPATRTPAARIAYLREHAIPSQANYVNTVGRSVDQIRSEARLREAIERFLDSRGHDPSESAGDVRKDIQRFVRSTPELAWARRRAPRPSLRWRLGETAHLVKVILVLTAAAPFALLVLPFYAVVLRFKEWRDPAPHFRPDPEHERGLADIEDYVTQNQFSAIGYVKPGPIRRLTAQVVIWLIDNGARHVFNRASLAGIKSIHFAHWTVLDDWRRVIFTSNYDGSHESYMDDFIDKVAFALNASFSNAVGYPKTRLLLFEGARRELEFKDYQRRRQIPTQVWHSAYDDLTALNIENNALIRSGLFGPLAKPDTEAWLRRF
jgi:hypothetical protein